MKGETQDRQKKKNTLKDGICKPTIIIIILNVNRIISKLKKD